MAATWAGSATWAAAPPTGGPRPAARAWSRRRARTISPACTTTAATNGNSGTSARQKIADRGLNMNLVTVERQFDHKKITFYFTAEQARRFPRAGARPGRGVPHPHRTAADRRARRGPAQGRPGHLRPRVLLRLAPARVRAGDPEDGQGAAAAPEPGQAVRPLRPPALLPDLRTRRVPGPAAAPAAGGQARGHAPGRGHRAQARPHARGGGGLVAGRGQPGLLPARRPDLGAGRGPAGGPPATGALLPEWRLRRRRPDGRGQA